MATSTLDTKPLDDQFTQFSSRIKLVNKKFKGKTDKKKYVILLIRHGFSCANRFKDTTKVLGGARQQYAYPASGLTGYGIKQALKFREFMQQIKDISKISKYIYSSNLLRAMETAKYIIDSNDIPIEKVFPIDGIREISSTIASCSYQSSGLGNTKDNVPLSLADYESKYPNNYNQIKKNLATPKDEEEPRSNTNHFYGWRENGKPKTSIQCDVHKFIKNFLPLVDEHQQKIKYEADDILFIPVVVHGSLIKKYSEQLDNKTKVENLGTFAIAVSRDHENHDNIEINGSVQLNDGVPKNTWNTLYKQLNQETDADDEVDKNVYCVGPPPAPKNKFNTKPNKRSRKRSKAKSRKRSKAKSRKRSKAKSRKRSKAKSHKRSKAKSRKRSKAKSRKRSKAKSRKSLKTKFRKPRKSRKSVKKSVWRKTYLNFLNDIKARESHKSRKSRKSHKRSKAKGKRNRKSFGKSLSSFNELVSIKS